MTDPNLTAVHRYHDRTKHGFGRFARSLGYLDWPNQPYPFRRYEGAESVSLTVPDRDEGATWDEVTRADRAPTPVTLASLSELFYYSLALSAWKQVTDPAGRVVQRWSLRVNPSSGNLHPTEAYLIGRPAGLDAGIHHYAPDLHAFETCGRLPDDAWSDLQATLPADAWLLALTSVQWREVWKYGERAYRYCQHDVGHALAALALAAARLGWRLQLLPHTDPVALERLLGTDRITGPEAEWADCLAVLVPQRSTNTTGIQISAETLTRLAATATRQGTANTLSAEHQLWPIIDEINEATQATSPADEGPVEVTVPSSRPNDPSSPIAAEIIRRRRSAQAMDPGGHMPVASFWRLLGALLPGANAAVTALPSWTPRVSLAVFVHRVDDLAPGLYLLARHPEHRQALRELCRAEFSWRPPAGCPAELPFFLLREDDLQHEAQLLSCDQAIAGHSVFSLGMLAQFDETLSELGAPAYPRLFWEAGMIGQLLYLEAEVAGLQGTGIGCFFDDEVHQLLGLQGHDWQSLYHFTVGRAVVDDRLQTLDAYAHPAEDASP